jgi:outer membrane protein TolC
LNLLRGLEPIVQRGIQLGGNQGDLIRLQVEIGKLENEVESLEDYRGPVDARLRSILNSENTGLFPWPEFSDQAIASPAPSIEALQSQMRRLNPELKSLLAQSNRMETMARLAAKDVLPNFSLGLTYIPTGSALTTPRPLGSGDDPWGFTVGFNVPIWGQKNKASRREAAARQSAVDYELSQTHLDLSRELEYRAYELADANRQASLYRETLIPRGQQALEITEVAYESGDATFLDVIDAQRELLAFERAYWRFAATARQRVADLEMYCGGILP